MTAEERATQAMAINRAGLAYLSSTRAALPADMAHAIETGLRGEAITDKAIFKLPKDLEAKQRAEEQAKAQTENDFPCERVQELARKVIALLGE